MMALPLAAQAASRTVVIDTDCGTDDLLAIAFLLSRRDIRIEAITTVHGLAHAARGAVNILRLLALAGRPEILVFKGSEAPLAGGAEFPAEWRRDADALTGVELPPATRKPEFGDAVDYLSRRQPPTILALGPLTNLAEAVLNSEVLIMGGAVRVRGNIGDGGFLKTDNRTAEWNFYADPAAARRVFTSGADLRVIPLDATNQVPVDAAFVRDFDRLPLTPLGRFASRVLALARKSIEGGYYFAWDPLAAAALVEPSLVRYQKLSLDLRLEAPEQGRSAEVRGRANARVAMAANAARFREVFFAAFRAK